MLERIFSSITIKLYSFKNYLALVSDPNLEIINLFSSSVLSNILDTIP